MATGLAAIWKPSRSAIPTPAGFAWQAAAQCPFKVPVTACNTPQPGQGSPNKVLIRQMWGTWIRAGAPATAASADNINATWTRARVGTPSFTSNHSGQMFISIADHLLRRECAAHPLLLNMRRDGWHSHRTSSDIAVLVPQGHLAHQWLQHGPFASRSRFGEGLGCGLYIALPCESSQFLPSLQIRRH